LHKVPVNTATQTKLKKNIYY